MRRTILGMLSLIFFEVALVGTAFAQSESVIGARVGIGTDVSGGIAYGGQLNYTMPQNDNSLELGLTFFGGSFEEDSDNGVNTYHEETDVLVLAGMVNYLFRHSMDNGGVYFLAGGGGGAFSVDWREESPTDTSLGSPLAGGGSFQEEDAVAGGLILNAGIGYRLSEKFDLRFQVPTFFIASGDTRDSQVVPTFTITAGYTF